MRYCNTIIFIYTVFLVSRLVIKGLKKLIILYSADLYKDFACYGYKRERQDLAKILQLLNAACFYMCFRLACARDL